MSNARYLDEFKIEAVKQIAELRLPVDEVAARRHVDTQPCRVGRLHTATELAYA